MFSVGFVDDGDVEFLPGQALLPETARRAHEIGEAQSARWPVTMSKWSAVHLRTKFKNCSCNSEPLSQRLSFLCSLEGPSLAYATTFFAAVLFLVEHGIHAGLTCVGVHFCFGIFLGMGVYSRAL